MNEVWTTSGEQDDVGAPRPRRVVYYGPGCSGKTSNLLALARRMNGGAARLRTLQAEIDGGLAFEFLACDGAELGYDHAGPLHLLAVPGLYLASRTRRILLPGADGIVFVADSRPERSDANMLLLDELGTAMVDLGLLPPRAALVLQYNHTDARDAVSAARLDREINRHGGPRTTAVASRGEGVVETLALLLDVLAPRRH